MKVLIAPDKFKGSLTALEVASHLAAGLHRNEGIHCTELPLADGGDGSARTRTGHHRILGNGAQLTSIVTGEESLVS